MNPALILEILGTIIQDTPEALALFTTVKGMVDSGSSDLTQAQWQTLLSAITAAHSKVQSTQSSSS